MTLDERMFLTLAIGIPGGAGTPIGLYFNYAANSMYIPLFFAGMI